MRSPEAMEGGGFPDHSHATPRPVPVGPARADPSRAFNSVVILRWEGKRGRDTEGERDMTDINRSGGKEYS